MAMFRFQFVEFWTFTSVSSSSEGLAVSEDLGSSWMTSFFSASPSVLSKEFKDIIKGEILQLFFDFEAFFEI